MPGESNPPRHLEDGVEPMLDLACPGCLAIEAVEHPDDESERKSPTEPTCCEENCDCPRNNVAQQRWLIRRNPSPTQTRDQKRFDGSVEPCRNVECTFLY